MAEPVIAIVMPCYNDSEVLPLSVERLSGILDTLVAAGKISPQSFMLCVNDGSTDGTWQLINKFHKSDPRVKGVALAHNRGQQCALMAGLMTVNGKCDAAITIDADLQDDPAVIGEMVEMFRDGKDIVYGVRKSRAIDSWFKRTSAHAFYRLQRSLGMNTIYDHADYRLMSDRAIGLLSEYGEVQIDGLEHPAAVAHESCGGVVDVEPRHHPHVPRCEIAHEHPAHGPVHHVHAGFVARPHGHIGPV